MTQRDLYIVIFVLWSIANKHVINQIDHILQDTKNIIWVIQLWYDLGSHDLITWPCQNIDFMREKNTIDLIEPVGHRKCVCRMFTFIVKVTFVWNVASTCRRSKTYLKMIYILYYSGHHFSNWTKIDSRPSKYYHIKMSHPLMHGHAMLSTSLL